MVFAMIEGGDVRYLCGGAMLGAEGAEVVARHRFDVVERLEAVGGEAGRNQGDAGGSLFSPLRQLRFRVGRNPGARILEAGMEGNGPVAFGDSQQARNSFGDIPDLLNVGIPSLHVGKGDGMEREQELAAGTVVPGIGNGRCERLFVQRVIVVPPYRA